MKENRDIPIDKIAEAADVHKMITLITEPKKRGRKPKGADVKKRTCAFSLSPETMTRLDYVAGQTGRSKSDLVDSILLHFFRLNP
jgi:hypothetical protein